MSDTLASHRGEGIYLDDVFEHSRDDPGSAVRGRGHDPPAARVHLVHRNRVARQEVHRRDHRLALHAHRQPSAHPHETVIRRLTGGSGSTGWSNLPVTLVAGARVAASSLCPGIPPRAPCSARAEALSRGRNDDWRDSGVSSGAPMLPADEGPEPGPMDGREGEARPG